MKWAFVSPQLLGNGTTQGQYLCHNQILNHWKNPHFCKHRSDFDNLDMLKNETNHTLPRDMTITDQTNYFIKAHIRSDYGVNLVDRTILDRSNEKFRQPLPQPHPAPISMTKKWRVLLRGVAFLKRLFLNIRENGSVFREKIRIL